MSFFTISHFTFGSGPKFFSQIKLESVVSFFVLCVTEAFLLISVSVFEMLLRAYVCVCFQFCVLYGDFVDDRANIQNKIYDIHLLNKLCECSPLIQTFASLDTMML